ISLKPGSYLVEARLPSGERTRARVSLEAGKASEGLHLAFSKSQHEWLGGVHYLDTTPQKDSVHLLRKSVLIGGDLQQIHSEFVPSLRQDWLVSIRDVFSSMSLASPTNSTHLVSMGPSDESACMYTVSASSIGTLRLLVIESTFRGVRLATMLPTSAPERGPSELNLVIHTPTREEEHGASSEQRNNPKTTIMRIGDPMFDGLVGFLFAGETKAVHETAVASERRLREKLEDPLGAALAAYILLRLRDLERLHDWTANLSNWFPWLPDGHLAFAWHRVLQGRFQDALEPVRKAVAAGPPIFSEGMRILGDLLRLLEDRDHSFALTLQQQTLAARSAWLPSRPFTSFDLVQFKRYASQAGTAADPWTLAGG
ncbi:MAG TPA: hypothetical protein VG963_15650, partial [Polyangiaceae bacterium]|nr:hypothetical protein [Polyangiaceae bacterium]